MKITKKIQGQEIILNYIKVKKYPNYTLYDVYIDNKLLYRTCLTSIQLKRLKKLKYTITECEEELI